MIIQEIMPIEFKVVIRPLTSEEKSEGGIIFADVTRDRMQKTQDIGILVSKSPMAFTFADGGIGWPCKIPEIGDWVLYEIHAGNTRMIGERPNQEEVRIMNDRDVIAIVDVELEEKDEKFKELQERLRKE